MAKTGIEIVIDQKRLDEIIGKLDPAVVKGYLRDLIKEAAQIGEREARALVIGKQDEGDAQAHYSIRADAQPLSAKIYSVMPEARALSIETGRKPGEQVPFMQLVRWTRGRYATSRNITPELREQVLDVAAKIKARGTEGLFFIKGAAEEVEANLPRLLDRMAKEIEEDFGR